MREVDKRELVELKRKRQQKLLSENPPKRIINAIQDPNNSSTDEEIRVIRHASNAKKEQLSHTIVRDNVKKTTDGNEYCDIVTTDTKAKKDVDSNTSNLVSNKDGELSISGFKVSGILQVILTVFGLVVAFVTAWVNFDNTLKTNTLRITKVETELMEQRKNNNEIFSFLTNDYEKRLNALEKDLNANINSNNTFNYQTIQDLERIKRDIDKLRHSSDANTADITRILRDIDTLENQIRKNTK